MPPPPEAPYDSLRQYGPDPASRAVRYHRDEEHGRLSLPQPRQDTTRTSRTTSQRLELAGNESREHDGRTARETWFDQANKALREPQLSTDDEPPFHPQGQGSSSTDGSSITGHPQGGGPNQGLATFAQQRRSAPPERTESGDYRSIIDDLTVENRDLKARLKKLEAALTPPVEVQQDRLFEVKVHGLPGHQKEDLIETLHAFAKKIDILKDNQLSQSPAAETPRPYVSVNRSVQPYGQLSTSPSDERLDSTYASASASGQPSAFAVDQTKLSSKKPSRQEKADPLEGTPAGLLYKGYDSSMTDREKKILVVKRLEHLFGGKGARSSKPSKGVPIAEGLTAYDKLTERMREAQILPSVEEAQVDVTAPDTDMIQESYSASQHEADREQCEPRPESPQRETRALDLDPNRIQLPLENIRYIRHLGMAHKIPGDENTDSGPYLGWVYLNILINLAQLHIFNVTPDFVRSAITEVSTRFELSDDRQKVRWKGGPLDQKVASDSEGDLAMKDAATDSSDSGSKRRKLADSSSTDEGGPGHNYLHSITASSTNRLEPSRGRRRHDLDYKPLFFKPKSSDRPQYYDDNASGYLQKSTVDGEACASIPATMMTYGTTYSTPRSDSGPIVFFSGAHFVTDLSGDPRHSAGQNTPRLFHHEEKRASITPLGADRPKRPRLKLRRSDSGSRIRRRPFKDYSKCAEVLQQDTRLRTPEPITSEDADSNDISFDPKWTDDGKSASPQQRILMEASGIGGTRPDDNFVVIVETAHPKMRSEFHKQLQAQVAASLDPQRRTSKLLHMIEEAKLDPVQLPKDHKGKEPAVQRHPPIKITVLSARELRLQPSETPPPAQLWDDDSDSDGDSDVSMDSSSTDQGIRELKKSPLHAHNVAHEEESEDDDCDNGDDDDDDDEVDMMAFDRVNNPTLVAEREGTYERQLRAISGEGRRGSGSSIATAGDDDDDDDEDEDEDD